MPNTPVSSKTSAARGHERRIELDVCLEVASPLHLLEHAEAAGWCAHVIEQHADDHLIRPQSEYVGPTGGTVGPNS